MSLVEPLLPKEDIEHQKLEASDPLVNLEKSIEKLSVEYESFEFDGTSDIESRSSESYFEKDFYFPFWKRYDIKCAAAFEHKLAIGRIDGIIKIYNLDTKEEAVLQGHSNDVNFLQVCVNQDFLVSGSNDETIIIWNLENYAQERVFQAQGEVFCLEVTCGYELFSGSLTDRFVRKWNFWNENESTNLTGFEGGITCIKSSHNGYFLVTGSRDRSIRIWSIEDSKELKVFWRHKGEIEFISITKDDKYIASGSSAMDIAIWDLEKKEIVQWIDLSFPKTLFLDVMSENICLYMKRNEDLIRAYDIENKKPIPLFRDKVTAITCSKDSNLVYYGRDNNTAIIFDVKNPVPIAVLKDFECKIYKMLIVGQDDYLASILENGKIKIHKILKENLQEDFSLEYRAMVHKIKLTKDGKFLILFNYNSLKIWNLIEKKEVFYYENITLLDVQISYDDKYFVFNDKKSSSLYVYSFQNMQEVSKFDVETPPMNFCFSISKDSHFIFVGKFDGTIAVFDIENKSKLSALEGGDIEITLLQANKTYEYIISADLHQNLIFWNFSQKKIINTLHMDSKIDFLKLSEKNNCVVVGMKNLIEIWDFQLKRKITSIQENPNPISCAEISEDEKYLIFAQFKETRIWSLEHMKEVDTVISNCDRGIASLDITRDSKYIAIGYGYLRIGLWSVEEKRFIAMIPFLDLGNCYAKFSSDGKSIIAYSERGAKVHSIEDYIDCSKIDSYPYFIPGEYDKIFRQRFANWIKNPTKDLWDKEFLWVVMYPIGYNVLHSLCINDSVDLLSNALKDGGEIFRDKQNMSPLSYALSRSSRRCIDEILNYVINLEDDKKQLYCIHQLRDDIPLLFNTKSLALVPFLEVLFRRRPDKDLIGFYEVTEELPMSIFSPVSKIYTSAFTGENDTVKKDSSKQKENLTQFWGSPLGYNYAAGSDESLLLLKKIDECENQEILQTLFVQSVIREKWEYLWPSIITISIIYWLNLITMVWNIFDPSIYILTIFAALNVILAFYEFLQFTTKPKDYVSEIWNLIDWIRMILSIAWAVLEFYDEDIEGLSFAVVLFNFLRGLTYFRAFDFTRFYVRLILMALSDSLAFLVIFLYSTLAFGVLYASLDVNLSFSGMWTMAYELNMGNFDNGGFSFLQYSCFTLATLINVVMMLNLLVSTLGDTFDKFQMITDELDSKEMLQLVLEFESIMFWARSEQEKLRNKGKLMYLQRCDIFQDSDVPDKWQGKIKEISLKIDGVKDDVFGIKKNASQELKKLEGAFEKIIDEKVMKSQERIEKSISEKIADLEGKVDSKINGLMEVLEAIKAKLEA